jgi:hypothetical protein
MANVLKLATVADIVPLIQAGSSDRRISALLSLDRGTLAKYRRQMPLDKSLTVPASRVQGRRRSRSSICQTQCPDQRSVTAAPTAGRFIPAW